MRDKEFITIRQAAILADKSEATIRRLVKGLNKDLSRRIVRRRRQFDSPKSPLVYRIRKDWVAKKYRVEYKLKPKQEIKPEGRQGDRETIQAKDQAIEMLKEQIKHLEQSLARAEGRADYLLRDLFENKLTPLLAPPKKAEKDYTALMVAITAVVIGVSLIAFFYFTNLDNLIITFFQNVK